MRAPSSTRKWLSLTWAERSALVEALWEVSITAVQLKRGKYELGVSASEARAPSLIKENTPVNPNRLAQLVEAVGRRVPWEVHCLNRSIALTKMLRRREMAPLVRLGVRRSDGTLQFHAWVELDGVVVNDRRDIASNFAPFPGNVPPDGARIV